MQLTLLLQDIASKITIKSSEFVVSHLNYKPVEFPPDVVAQLRQLPQEIQYKYLNSLLRDLIYGTSYNGSFIQEINQGVKGDYPVVENTAAVEVDWEFYEQLSKNNTGKGWFNQNFRVLRQEADGSLAVQKLGLTVHIQRNLHLQLADQSANMGDIVSIKMPPSAVQKGFYMAIGDAAGNFRDPDNTNKVVFVYFNFSPEGAIAVMKCLTAGLNSMQVPFSFKVPYNPSNYKQYDSGILRFDQHSYKLVRQVLQTVYAENKSYFQTKVPLFTKVLAPGIALAEAPKNEFTHQEGFGMNRCQIVANALLEAQKNDNEYPEARIKYILKHFDCFGIDLERPYLNPDSKDIYTPLD